MPQASPGGNPGVKRAFCRLHASWLCSGARDTLLRPHPLWLHSHGDASKMTLINEFILTHGWVSASQLSPLPGPDRGFKPHPQPAAAYTSKSNGLLSPFLFTTRDAGAAVKMQGESLCAKLCCHLMSKLWQGGPLYQLQVPHPGSTTNLFPGLSWGWCQWAPIKLPQTMTQQIPPAH